MSKYKTIYRVVENKDYNEFNTELRYTILTYDYDEAKNKIRRRGWNSWHGLKGEQIFHSRTMAEKWLCELNYNYFFNKSAQAEKIKWQDQQIAELQQQLKSQPKQIVDEIKNIFQKCWYVNEKKDEFYGTFLISKFNEEKFYNDLDDLLKNMEGKYDTVLANTAELIKQQTGAKVVFEIKAEDKPC